MNWKIVAAASIVVIVAFVLVARTPQVTSFFISLQDIIDTAPANVSFSYSSADYSNMTIDAGKSEIVIVPENISLEIAGGRFSSPDAVALSDFKGTVKISENTVRFEGTITKLAVGQSSIAYDNQFVKGSATFLSLSVTNASMPLVVSEGEGTLVVRGTSIAVSDGVRIYAPAGSFYFDGTLSVAGVAKKIEIPATGLVVK